MKLYRLENLTQRLETLEKAFKTMERLDELEDVEDHRGLEVLDLEEEAVEIKEEDLDNFDLKVIHCYSFIVT